MITTPENPKNFCIVCNEVARRRDLSARAKGIYYYLATLPPSWELQQQEAEQHFTEGREAFRTAFKELIVTGYIKQIRLQDAKGRLTGWKYNVLWSSDAPEMRETDTPENQYRENRKAVNQLTENPTLLNTDILNTDLSIIESSKQDSVLSNKPTQSPTKKFNIPDKQEIRDYFFELGHAGLEADKYFDYYSANGWMVGKSKMKDWKAAVRNWARNIKTTETQKPQLEYQKKGQSYNGYL